MRQTKTKSEKAIKQCSSCGAKTWLFDEQRQIWTGPWHFQDCATLAGNSELLILNAEFEAKWNEEKVVSREMGRRILKAIFTMLEAPDHTTMLKTKTAIQERLKAIRTDGKEDEG